mmetsp:Transcript_38959/g.69729  ORF Transcript_38959/g.69729 Transcript_38959/m.69729 type:complete len:251 (+) Transcript_38959:1947-2699(+)
MCSLLMLSATPRTPKGAAMLVLGAISSRARDRVRFRSGVQERDFSTGMVRLNFRCGPYLAPSFLNLSASTRAFSVSSTSSSSAMLDDCAAARLASCFLAQASRRSLLLLPSGAGGGLCRGLGSIRPLRFEGAPLAPEALLPLSRCFLRDGLFFGSSVSSDMSCELPRRCILTRSRGPCSMLSPKLRSLHAVPEISVGSVVSSHAEIEFRLFEGLIAMLIITFLMSRVSKDDSTMEGQLEVWDWTDVRRPR